MIRHSDMMDLEWHCSRILEDGAEQLSRSYEELLDRISALSTSKHLYCDEVKKGVGLRDDYDLAIYLVAELGTESIHWSAAVNYNGLGTAPYRIDTTSRAKYDAHLDAFYALLVQLLNIQNAEGKNILLLIPNDFIPFHLSNYDKDAVIDENEPMQKAIKIIGDVIESERINLDIINCSRMYVREIHELRKNVNLRRNNDIKSARTSNHTGGDEAPRDSG